MAVPFKFHPASALLDRLSQRQTHSRKLMFLVGSALTAPSSPSQPGIPGVSGMVDLIRREIAPYGEASVTEFDRLIAMASNRYSDAFEFLISRAGPDRANEVIRRAVLLARREPAGNRMSDADLLAFEKDPGGWRLTTAVESLGQIMANAREWFSPQVLTTNFDPLVQVSLRRAGITPIHSELDGDGRPDQVHGDVCHVVHLHGYWLRSDTLHTPNQLQRHRPQLQGTLERWLTEYTIVVLGYGGWEDVFSAALDRVLASPGHKPDLIWSFYNSQPTAIEAQYASLLARLRPGCERNRVNLYAGVDLHDLLPRLHHQFASIRGSSPHSSLPQATGTNGTPSTADEFRILSSPSSTPLSISGPSLVAEHAVGPAHRLVTVGGPLPTRTFVGRKMELRSFENLFKPAEVVKIGQLYGPPGVGKSATAAQLAEKLAQDYQAVWLRFGTNPRAAWLQLAEAMGLAPTTPDPQTNSPAWLEETKERLRCGRYLVIVDDLDDRAASDTLKWLPKTGNGRSAVLLLTSGSMPLLQSKYNANSMCIGSLSNEEQHELLEFLADEFPKNKQHQNSVDLIRKAQGQPVRLRNLYFQGLYSCSQEDFLRSIQRHPVLGCLNRAGSDPIPKTVLADALSLTQVGLSESVEGLANAGYIELYQGAVRSHQLAAEMLRQPIPSPFGFLPLSLETYAESVIRSMLAARSSEDLLAQRQLVPHLHLTLREFLNLPFHPQSRPLKTFHAEPTVSIIGRLADLLETCSSGDPFGNRSLASEARRVLP